MACSCGHIHVLMTIDGRCASPKLCGCTNDPDIRDLMNLDLEYRLTIAHRIDCACAPYFVRRREVLIPEILKQAKAENKEPVSLFHAFQLKVHEKLCSGETPRSDRGIGRYVALMAVVKEREDEDAPGS